MNLRDYYLNIPALAKTPVIGKYFRAPEPISPLVPDTQKNLENYDEKTGTITIRNNPNYEGNKKTPVASQSPIPMAAPQPSKPQISVSSGLYDAAQEIGKVYGIDPRNFIANSGWEHRLNKAWQGGKYGKAVWWDANRNTGEASYGPYQINMRYFGPDAVKLGRITEDNPLYITPEQAMDPYASTKWQAKKWDREMRAGIKDWSQLFQLHNSNEKDRAVNVMKIINDNEFVRGQ